MEGASSLSRTEDATPKRLGNGCKGGGEEQLGCRIFARRKLICLIVVSDRPARLRISYGKDVIVFAKRHGLHCGEIVLAVFEGTGLARPRVESFKCPGVARYNMRELMIDDDSDQASRSVSQ